MSASIDVRIDTGKIISRLGLRGEATERLAQDVKEYCEPYVPVDTGALRRSADIQPAGTDTCRLIYRRPYAARVYYGTSAAGRPLRYHGGPMTGPYWDRQMLSAHSGDLERDLDAFFGGRS